MNFPEFIYRNFPFAFQIAIMQMEVFGNARKNIKELWIDPFEYQDQLASAVLGFKQRQMNIFLYNMQLCIVDENLRKYCKKSISDWKIRYLPKCIDCSLKENCSGVFSTSGDHISKYIKPIYET